MIIRKMFYLGICVTKQQKEFLQLLMKVCHFLEEDHFSGSKRQTPKNNNLEWPGDIDQNSRHLQVSQYLTMMNIGI